MQLIRNILSTLGALFLLTAVGASSAQAEKLPLAGKSLVVYVAFREEEGKALLEAFRQKTGVEYSFLRMPAGEIIARVEAEQAAPRVDVILGGAAENHQFLCSKGLLEKYTSPSAAGIPAAYRDSDGHWTGFYVGPIAIGINEKLWEKDFAPKGVSRPRTLEDLLNPAFKGKITMPDPLSSGTGFTFIASVLQAMGEEKGYAFLQRLHDQVGQFTASGLKPAELTGQGDYPICINFLHDQLLVEMQGKPLASRVPEGAGWEIGAVSMLKNAPDQEAAKAFIDFMLGAEAGRIHSSMTQRLSTRSDVPLPKGAIPLARLPINKNFSFAGAAQARQAILDKWKSF